MPTSPTGKTSSCKGFTLIEAVVVVVLMVVLGGMVVMSLAGTMETAGLRESARRLLVSAQYARAYAATRATRCRLVLDTQASRFHLEHEVDPVQQPGQFEPITQDLMRPQTLERGVRFGEIYIESQQAAESADTASDFAPATSTAAADGTIQAAAVTFSPNGSADAAIIELTNGRQSGSIRIAPTTGRAEWVDGQADEMLSDRYDLDLEPEQAPTF
ncbi:MAG TPA: prepilin-type N-terminal cleavage/methylation domain-containing protein [Phycisphaeraceae bacterium]